MTALLDRAFAEMRALSDDDQNMFAAVLLSAIAPDEIAPLDDAARAAIRTGVAQAEADDLAPEAEIAALWRRYDL